MNHGEPLENWLESELQKAFDSKLIQGYKREEKKARLKRNKRTTGKYDFEVTLNDGRTLAIECKSVSIDSRMNTPMAKSSPAIKTHQLIALRKADIGSLLLEYRNTDSRYWLTIAEFYDVVAEALPSKSINQKLLKRQINGFEDILREVE